MDIIVSLKNWCGQYSETSEGHSENNLPTKDKFYQHIIHEDNLSTKDKMTGPKHVLYSHTNTR